MHSQTIYPFKELKEETNKKKIIFLDIDGVIQPTNDPQYRFKHDMEKTVEYLCNRYGDNIYKIIDIYDVNAAYYDWDDEAIGLIKKLLYITNSYIVLHSGWKEYNNLKQMKALFKIYDMDERCIDICKSGDKIRVLQEYLEEHKDEIDNYVIIDDLDLSKDFSEHFIKTQNYFTKDDFNAALKILKIFKQ